MTENDIEFKKLYLFNNGLHLMTEQELQIIRRYRMSKAYIYSKYFGKQLVTILFFLVLLLFTVTFLIGLTYFNIFLTGFVCGLVFIIISLWLNNRTMTVTRINKHLDRLKEDELEYLGLQDKK